ncbi:unnamed protein product [Phytomonas sp. EM1]|nr:unnamed protein product [Phytomonas sp. EM1]|eukprot:CCW61195.1 unnamed protein product [Phytomonas sp. isolate EM1]
MFFWGGYSFQIPHRAEKEGQPPLRFPMYVPPCISTLNDTCSTTMNGNLGPGGASGLQTTLERILHQRLQIRLASCGAKHAVLVLADSSTSTFSSQPLPHGVGEVFEAPQTCHGFPTYGGAMTYGLGSNHSGQLGQHVATYTTSLTNLHLEEVMEGTIVSVACGERHTLVCTSSGCVYASGDNSCGQLGLPTHIGCKIRSGFNNGAACVTKFTQIPGIARIKQVYASYNASFALNAQGQLYSWGSAMEGHLGHNDNGERIDPSTMRVVIENTITPRLVRWFEQHHVSLVEVAVGRAHIVCRSTEDIYTFGEGFFGKLGHGDVLPRLQPTRVKFPPRKQPESLISIAAGDDHTLVLNENSSIGSIVYFFGRLGNGDGQLHPLVVPMPTAVPLTRVFSSRGNQCLALSMEGVLYVWGKHSYPKVYNGTNSSALRARPSAVEVLLSYRLTGVAAGGTFLIAFASERKTKNQDMSTCVAKDDEGEIFTGSLGKEGHEWDVVVPHDARVGANHQGDPEEVYEEGVRRFLQQYLGEELGAAYAAGLPAAPARARIVRYQFEKIGSHGLTVGQKVRLWMTDLYAIGTVLKIENSHKPILTRDESTFGLLQSDNQSNGLKAEVSDDVKNQNDGVCNVASHPEARQKTRGPGCRVRIGWQRDDWNSEVVTLYSDDETLSDDNPNRWQPYWFERNDRKEYTIAKSY